MAGLKTPVNTVLAHDNIWVTTDSGEVLHREDPTKWATAECLDDNGP